MNKKVLISLCIILLLFGTSCSNKDVIEENSQNVKKIKELENKIDDLQKQIDESKTAEETSKAEKEFYLDFIKKLTTPMSEEYLLQIARAQWSYTVLIDEVPIPKNGIIEISADNFNLTVIEEQTPYVALPLEIHNKGKISGNLFSNHIKFVDVKPSNTTGSDENIVSSTTYTFKNLAENNMVNLEISPELQERLGLDSNIISIRSKKSETTKIEDTSTSPLSDKEENKDKETQKK